MAPREYDVAFLGGGLAATLLLHGLRTSFPRRVAVIDPWPLSEQPPVHWSYWSRRPTPYDRFAIGTWFRARVGNAPPEPIAPFALRLVRSSDVLAGAGEPLRDLPIERLCASALSVKMRAGGLYEVETDVGAVSARWVFDSACEVEPSFPSARRPRAVLSGTGLRVEASAPIFDDGIATLFDPLDERSFAYLLPLSPTEALLESASFGPEGVGEDREPLVGYLRSRYPKADFYISHSEHQRPRHTTFVDATVISFRGDVKHWNEYPSRQEVDRGNGNILQAQGPSWDVPGFARWHHTLRKC